VFGKYPYSQYHKRIARYEINQKFAL
jgi:hypothetical protein